jgi:hypothetical protein
VKAALFCLGNLSVLLLASRWAAKLASRRLDIAVGLAALYPILAVSIMVIAGLTDQLHPGRVVLVLVVAALAVMAGARGDASGFFCGFGDVGDLKLAKSVAGRAAAGAVIAFASFPLVRVLTAGTGYFIDDFGYHSMAAATWIQSGGFGQIMPQFMAYLPLNAELLSGWFALPYHHDAMVALASVVWLALAAIAAGGLVRLGGGDATASLLTAAAILASPPLVWQTRTFSACDLAGSAGLLAAIYFARNAIATRRFGLAVAAGLLAGFAAGTKATFLPVTALICLYPLCAPMPLRNRLSSVAVMSLSAAALGALWYLRNWAASGNPLFPAQIGPFAGPLTSAEQTDIKLIGLLREVPWTPRLWGHMIWDYLAWPFPFGLLAAAGYFRAIIVDCFRITPRVREDASLRRLLLVCGAAQFILHFFAPFCLGGGYVGGRIEVYTRYVMPWFVVGLVLGAPLLDARSRYAWGWRALAAAGLVMCWPTNGFMRFGGVAVALGGVALLYWLPARTWKPLALAAAIAVWPLLAIFEPRMRAETNQNFRDFLRTRNGKSLGDAILALESLPAGARVTRFSNDAYLNSPLFGRSWQLHPIFTDNTGITLPPLHAEFRANPALTFSGPAPLPLPTPRQFISNLRSSGVTDVFVTKFSGADWPPQQALLKESGEAIESFDDGDSALWRLSTPSQ